MSELTTKFDSLEAGDKIVVPQYANPLTVVEVLGSVGIVELEGQRGGEKSLVQNKNNPESISLMAGADKKGMVTEFEIVNKEITEDEDDEDDAQLEEADENEDNEEVAEVRVDDTQAPNPRVVIHVKHPEHDKGVRAFYRRADSDVAGTIRDHLRRELDADIKRVDVTDTSDVGLVEADLLEREPIEATATEVFA